ncbi:hypothetical protein MKW98_013066 [Papaver atlanticum]|uniref:Uncharacterized protein n=1 Tax=Papaver atlanticum TaxID=357466 RepID=A0AAD4XT51_9MAGN|nr:hypothetical protein MKW98_013066 [Papaver atlanticum]
MLSSTASKFQFLQRLPILSTHFTYRSTIFTKMMTDQSRKEGITSQGNAVISDCTIFLRLKLARHSMYLHLRLEICSNQWQYNMQ